jgi:hypothetical protein
MPMTPHIAAARITRSLVATEHDLDRALANGASLLADIAQARMDTGTDVATGQVAIMRLTEALGALSTARKHVIQTHAELRKVGETRADFILPSECPKSAEAGEDEVAPLREVA